MSEELTFAEAWDNLKEAIHRANTQLAIEVKDANTRYEKTIAPYREALKKAEKPRVCDER